MFLLRISALLSLVLCVVVSAQDKPSEEMHKLGRQKIGAYTVSVIMIGEADAGHTVEFDVKLFDNNTDPKAIRVWIGSEDGKGSEKVQLKKKTDTFAGKLKVPDPKPEKSKVWVEVETDSGTTKGSYAMEEHDHKH